MSLRSFARLEPLASDLAGRTLTLPLDHLPGKGPLQATRAPRAVCRNVLGMQLEQQQISHDRQRDRAFHPIDVFGDLMLPQPHDAFEFLHQPLDPPPSQVYTDNLPCGHRLGPIGHQNFGLFRPVVAPTCAEHHGDVSQMAQLHAFGIDPTGPAALGIDGRNANLGIFPARQMRHQVFDGFASGKFPRPREGHGVPVAQRLDNGQIDPGGVSRIGGDHDLLAPGRAPELLQHLAKQGVFGLVVGIVFPSDQGEIYRDAIDIPLGHKEDDAEAEDIRMVPAEARFLGHRMLGAPFALEGAVADQIQETILGWGQGLQGLLGEPPQQGFRAPIRRAQQAPVVLVGQVGRTMPGQGLEIGALPVDEVQHQEPAEDQLVPMMETGTQYPQALGHATGQPGQRHGPGLLGDTRSDGHSRSSIPGRTWTVKGFHGSPCANLSPLRSYNNGIQRTRGAPSSRGSLSAAPSGNKNEVIPMSVHPQAAIISSKIKYEWDMFQWLANRIANEWQTSDQMQRNLLLEGCLLHAKVLRDFLIVDLR
jgi:hypothetical protein